MSLRDRLTGSAGDCGRWYGAWHGYGHESIGYGIQAQALRSYGYESERCRPTLTVQDRENRINLRTSVPPGCRRLRLKPKTVAVFYDKREPGVVTNPRQMFAANCSIVLHTSGPLGQQYILFIACFNRCKVCTN